MTIYKKIIRNKFAKTKIFGQEIELTWNITRVSNTLSAFHTFKCVMVVDNVVSVNGYGTSMMPATALYKAFSEAWERVVVTYYNLKNDNRVNTNGFAAGWSLEKVVTSAVAELVERQSVLLSWSKRRGWMEISLGLADLLLIPETNRGWSFRFCKISTNLGDAFVGFGRHKSRGFIFDSVYDRNKVKATYRLACSLSRMASVSKEFAELTDLAFEACPSEHRDFYFESNRALAFDFISLKSDVIEIENVEAIKCDIMYFGREMPIVIRASNASWIPLTWGKQSLKFQDHKWPHPIS